MSTYLDRYLAGEHEAVWRELTALGPAVRQAPLYADALAVARETMRRVHENLETLIARLSSLGYRFGYVGRDPSLSELLADVLRTTDKRAPDSSDIPFTPDDQSDSDEFPHVLAGPYEDTPARLAWIASEYGEIPLSIQAWYEQVGSVNLVGSFPVADPLKAEGLNDVYQYRAAHARLGLRDYQRPAHDLDPLWIYSLQQQARHLRSTQARTPHTLLLAPCDFTKQGFWACRPPYQVRLPNPGMDGIVLGERHHTTFVGYLRACMQWGGFPGLELRNQKLIRELALLTDGLAPI